MAAPTPVRQVIQNGNQNYVVNLNVQWTSGATDDLANYTIADGSAAGDMGVSFGGNVLYPLTHLKIFRISYDVSPGINGVLSWDANSDQVAYVFNGDGSGKQMFRPQGGIFIPPTLAGATGKLFLSTTHSVAALTDGYMLSLEIWLKKDIRQ